MNAVAYLVIYNDVPDTTNPFAEFDSASSAALGTFDGRVLDSRDFSFRGYPARVAPNSRNLPFEADQFLKSFDLV